MDDKTRDELLLVVAEGLSLLINCDGPRPVGYWESCRAWDAAYRLRECLRAARATTNELIEATEQAEC